MVLMGGETKGTGRTSAQGKFGYVENLLLENPLRFLKTRFCEGWTFGNFFWKPENTMCFQVKISMSMAGTGNHFVYKMAAQADDTFNKEFLKINCLVVS